MMMIHTNFQVYFKIYDKDAGNICMHRHQFVLIKNVGMKVKLLQGKDVEGTFQLLTVHWGQRLTLKGGRQRNSKKSFF
jgi:hypothetical protein